jgi:hypothetical protein
MKPFNIKLSDEHRAKLEAYRAARGLRSEADAVRDLIERAEEVATPSAPVRGDGAAFTARADAFLREAKPFKSRLKGEWKAP